MADLGAGGDWPRWRSDGKELYYHSIGPVPNPESPGNPAFVGPVYAVTVNGAGTSLEHAAPKAIMNLRAINFPHADADYHTYAVSPDGQRFLYYQFVVPAATIAQASGLDHPNGLMIATNWASGLKK